jgi:hypothetical protein
LASSVLSGEISTYFSSIAIKEINQNKIYSTTFFTAFCSFAGIPYLKKRPFTDEGLF